MPERDKSLLRWPPPLASIGAAARRKRAQSWRDRNRTEFNLPVSRRPPLLFAPRLARHAPFRRTIIIISQLLPIAELEEVEEEEED